MSRYSTAQKEKLKHFIDFAQRGDKVANRVIHGLINKYYKGSSGSTHLLKINLVSNEILSKFKVPVRFKYLPIGTVDNSPRHIGRAGDTVEAYIYFLQINYGTQMVERYIIKELTKISKVI